MKLSRQEVEHIAKLARLGLTEAEQERFASQLSSILDYVDQLQAVDTRGIETTAQVTGLENVFRPDAVESVEPSVRADLLKQAPATESNLVKTKSVFE